MLAAVLCVVRVSRVPCSASEDVPFDASQLVLWVLAGLPSDGSTALSNVFASWFT
jgi:hypothetical protein